MGIRPDVDVVVFQDGPQEFVFRVRDCLDDEAVVARKIEEGTGFSWRPEFGEDVLCRQGKQIICRVEMKVFVTQVAEDPWGVVFELKIVLGGWCELVADAIVSSIRDRDIHVKGEFVASAIVLLGERPLDLGLTPRHTDPDPREHVVHEYIVDMIFANQVADQNFGIFLLRLGLG